MNIDLHTTWILAIKQHALDNYNTDGWDYCVETMGTEDIADIIAHPLDGKPVTTLTEAIAAVAAVCELLDDRRRDIRATAF